MNRPIILMTEVMLLFSFHTSAMAVETPVIESIRSDHVTVSLLSPRQLTHARSHIGVRFQIDPGWHVYWQNPGDSGAAPKFSFESRTASLGAPMWPPPERLPVGELTNFGYKTDVTIPFEISPASNAQSVSLQAKLEWLVCDEGECLPGFTTLALDRPVGEVEKWDIKVKAMLDSAIASTPQLSENSAWQITRAERSGESVTVHVISKGVYSSAERAPDLFPVNPDLLKPQEPVVARADGELQYRFQLQTNVTDLHSLDFVLSASGRSWSWRHVPVGAQMARPESASAGGLWILLLSSFFGGLLLNFMPCVLPVLTIKFFSIAQTPASQRLRDSLLYTLGVLVTFGALGIVFLFLRSAGESVGWGFQLQSPVIVFSMAVLFWLMALNFLGFVEFGTSVMNVAGKSKSSGSFFTGILSVFIAAPCTGPFMGTALGAAATLPAIGALSIFLMLGVGLASPFVLVSIVPGARRWIPRPGVWMDKLKQFFAFPLLATVIWLLWVLSLQTGLNAVPLALSALLTVSLAIWWGKQFHRQKVLAWAFAVAVLGSITYSFSFSSQDALANEKSQTKVTWQNFDPAAVDSARRSGKPVFIDFTAAWCITCQVNKRAVLRTRKIETLLAEKQVALFEADWTKQDKLITEALAKYNRNSVPLYVYYPPGANEPKILPQILTAATMIELFNVKGE